MAGDADRFQRDGADVGLHGAGDADDERKDYGTLLTATIVADDKPYDTTNAATVHTCQIGGVIDGAGISCSATAGTFADSHVGTWPVAPTDFSVTGLTSDYTAPATPTTSAKITALPLTATIAADDKPYDTTNAATVHTCQVGGVIDGAGISCSATAGTFADSHADLAGDADRFQRDGADAGLHGAGDADDERENYGTSFDGDDRGRRQACTTRR